MAIVVDIIDFTWSFCGAGFHYLCLWGYFDMKYVYFIMLIYILILCLVNGIRLCIE